jgi:hypothetical protein
LSRKALKIRAFLRYEVCLQTPNTGNFSEKMPKVSGSCRKYSRFGETFGGDFFRSALRGAGGSCFCSFEDFLYRLQSCHGAEVGPFFNQV